MVRVGSSGFAASACLRYSSASAGRRSFCRAVARMLRTSRLPGARASASFATGDELLRRLRHGEVPQQRQPRRKSGWIGHDRLLKIIPRRFLQLLALRAAEHRFQSIAKIGLIVAVIEFLGREVADALQQQTPRPLEMRKLPARGLGAEPALVLFPTGNGGEQFDPAFSNTRAWSRWKSGSSCGRPKMRR